MEKIIQYEPYVRLAEAVIDLARRDYENAGKWLMDPPRVTIKQRHVVTRMISRYLNCREFFLDSCNGLVSEDGSTIVNTMDRRLGLDHDFICDTIKYFEKRFHFERSFEERFTK